MKIAIIQLGRIGDLVLLTSAIKPIKNKFPNSKIYFIVGKSNYFVLENNPDVEKILILDKNPLKLIPFLIKFKTIKFDYYIDPKDHFSTESNLLARIANAKIKIGFNDKNRNSKSFDIGIASDFENKNLHFVERIGNILKHIGIYSDENILRPSIFIDVAHQKIVNDFLQNKDISNFILLNISASSETRMWLPEKWIALINAIKDRKIIIFSAPHHSDTVAEICSKTNAIHFPPSKLMIISVLISKSDLVISPDTSVIHIASAFDIPVISLVGNISNNVVKFYPLSTKKEVILTKSKDDFVNTIEIEDVLKVYNEKF